MPAINCAMPALVIAEPKKTGYTCPRRVCSASSARSWSYGTPASFCTYVASSLSLCSASSSVSPVVNSVSSAPDATKLAPCVPGLVTRPMAKAAIFRRLAMSCSTPSGLAPGRSILFTNSRAGISKRCSERMSIRVCACAPSTAEMTSTTPSRTFSTRSTSAMKSGWPGVSIKLTATFPIGKDATADLIVIPRRRSNGSKSVWVVPASTAPSWSMTPESYSSRSVRVVLPASTCARIPKLSVFCDTRHIP